MITLIVSLSRRITASGAAGLFAAAALLAGGQAAAQFSQNSDEPIDITGAQFEALQDEDVALWTGDVQVVQGEVVLTAPRLKIFGIGGGEFERVEASGGIRYTNGTEAISGENAVYRADDDTIVVTGDVVVVQGRQVMTGEKMTYYLDTGRIIFDAGSTRRVRGIFFTDDEATPAAPSDDPSNGGNS